MEFPGNATPVSPQAMAAAVVPAYAQRFGHAPDRETAELLLALLFIENDHGRAVIEHNWGNISTFAGPGIDYWRPPWFDLDKVNARPDTDPKKQRYLALHQQMLDHRAPSAFRAFGDDQAGIVVWLANVKPTMYAAAATGDPMAFANAYWSSGYCPDEACRESGPTFRALQNEIRAAKYFADLEPSKKKAGEGATQLPHLPPPPSSAGSFGRLSAPVPVGGDMKRELVVFAASCEMADCELLLEQGDAAGVQKRIAVYWADVRHQAETAPHPKEWCGALCLWSLHQAGLGLELTWRFQTATDKRSGFLYALELTHEPKPGDIAYLDKPWQHHAIVVAVEDGTVHTIDGNQGLTAPIKTHEAPLSHWTAFYSIERLLAAGDG